MSIAEFSKVFRERILLGKTMPAVPYHLDIFRSIKENTSAAPSKVYRSRISEKKGNFKLVIPRKDITLILTDSALLAEIKASGGTLDKSYSSETDVIIVKNIDWTAAKLLVSKLKQLDTTKSEENLGHYIGSATGQVADFTANIRARMASGSNKKGDIGTTSSDIEFGNALLNLTKDFEDNLREFDKVTSSLPNSTTLDFRNSFEKTFNNNKMQFLVSSELAGPNQLAGAAVGVKFVQLRAVISRISKLAHQYKTQHLSTEDFSILLSKDKYFKKMLNSLSTELQGVSWVNVRGSSSMLEYLEYSLFETLNGRVPKKEISKGTAITSARVNIDYTNLIKTKNQINELRKQNQKLIADTRTIEEKRRRARNKKGQFISATNIQALLNTKLASQIKQNMGLGNSKSILNLRTGRFAESVNIQKISLQRDNAIAIFYSYMKYPYQTFEPGFEQGSPNSRNPITLINKSIRELASTLVTNRLRMFSI